MPQDMLGCIPRSTSRPHTRPALVQLLAARATYDGAMRLICNDVDVHTRFYACCPHASKCTSRIALVWLALGLRPHSGAVLGCRSHCLP